MKCSVVFLALVLGCVWAAPVEQDGLEQASCTDPIVLGAANQAMDKINKDRNEGYVYSMHNLVNAHMQKHGENSVMFYLTMNVVETNCSVFSKTHFKDCKVRDMTANPVYGQCKVAIFISRVHRVVRLYKYNCAVRPVAPAKVIEVCPDCPILVNKDGVMINKSITLTLAKFNNYSGLANHFALLKINRATSGMGMGMFYNAEYTIQETTCANGAEIPDNCPLMDCEFAHKGFCKGSLSVAPNNEQFVIVDCQIYESEASEREKKLHLLGGETDHSHNDSHTHDHGHDHGHTDGHDHAHDHKHDHDHMHDHTKRPGHNDNTQKHAKDDDHHHTHDHHDHSAHRHAHDHSHDHGIGHDHVHDHHGKAHNHSGDFPNHHHKYEHSPGTYTHEHDHEMALDHDHKHGHLHEHEHHHHHHGHEHEKEHHDHPEGIWRELPELGAPAILPAFPDTPVAGPEVGVILILKPDPQIPGQTEPSILPHPTKKSAECVPPLLVEDRFIGKLFAEDPEFKPTA